MREHGQFLFSEKRTDSKPWNRTLVFNIRYKNLRSRFSDTSDSVCIRKMPDRCWKKYIYNMLIFFSWWLCFPMLFMHHQAKYLSLFLGSGEERFPDWEYEISPVSHRWSHIVSISRPEWIDLWDGCALESL